MTLSLLDVRGGVTLRPYQRAAVDQIGDRGRVLLVVPTGGGKTVLAVSIIAGHFDRRVLFVAHRLELIDQTVRQLARWGVHDVGVIRADDSRTNPHARVQVASVQTLVRRDAGAFDICIIDEAHRATADSYVRAVFDRYPDALHIGLTATPWRLEGKPLGDLYDRMVIGAEYSQLIADGFIAEPLVFSTPKPVDLSGVRTIGGDYREDDLALAVMGLVGSVAEELAEKRDGRRGVVFAVNIDHSRALTDKLQSLGLRAAHLDGETPLVDRRQILADLDAGALDIVSNVGVLTEGWDMPSVKIASIARPTKSLSLWMQMAGRILRPWQGVTPILLDHGGNVDRHDIPTIDREWSLKQKPEPKGKALTRICKACFVYYAISKPKCPQCGWEPPKPPPKEIVEDGRKLVQVGAKSERDIYDDFVQKARAKGFKPGFAAAQFKEKFGRWPPWAWSQETKTDFAHDVTWQERLRIRTEDRERWQRRQAPTVDEHALADQVMAAAEQGNFTPAAEAVETLLDWLHDQEVT